MNDTNDTNDLQKKINARAKRIAKEEFDHIENELDTLFARRPCQQGLRREKRDYWGPGDAPAMRLRQSDYPKEGTPAKELCDALTNFRGRWVASRAERIASDLAKQIIEEQFKV